MSEVVRKKDLIEAVSTATKQSKALVGKIIDSLIDASREKLLAGDSVFISGLVNFKSVDKAERSGKNPLTGKQFNTPAHKSIKVTTAKDIIDSLKGK